MCATTNNKIKGDALQYRVPELLSPAGSLEKLKVAISYGADAVYVGGLKFGLRSAAENFTDQELLEGVEFAHARNAKVYVVLNSFLFDQEIEELPEFVKYLEKIGIDAVIVSDLGVLKTVSDCSNIHIHLSTQASCLNVESAKLWKKMGVTRVIVGRELSIKETAQIKKETGLEVELFVHGSMCMAYSGNCVISNYTQGRDSNRGGCAHSCRFEYSIKFQDLNIEDKKTYFMSSKDLNGVNLLQDFIDHNIDSIKVEGRMKSNLYAGTISKVYSEALKHYKEHGNFLSNEIPKWEEELRKVAHRDYTNASLVDKADDTSIFNEREISDSEYKVAANVIEVVENDYMIVDVKNAFHFGDTLELVPFKGESIPFNADNLRSLHNEKIDRTNPSTLVKLNYVKNSNALNIIRMKTL